MSAVASGHGPRTAKCPLMTLSGPLSHRPASGEGDGFDRGSTKVLGFNEDQASRAKIRAKMMSAREAWPHASQFRQARFSNRVHDYFAAPATKNLVVSTIARRSAF